MFSGCLSVNVSVRVSVRASGSTVSYSPWKEFQTFLDDVVEATDALVRI